jgi:hypothetical protein
LFLAIILNSCKTDEEIGVEVQPPEDKLIIGFDEQFGISAYTIKEDSVKSDETLLNLLGSYNDPVFGTSTAGFYVQFRLKDNGVTFGPNPVIDSVVLALAYSSYYGDISVNQNVKVYEVTEDFKKDSVYYSNRRFSYDPIALADYSFVPKPNDSVSVNGVKYGPHIRIRLDNAFGQEFLNESGLTSLSNNDEFVKFFKGLYVAAEPRMVKAAILYLSIMAEPSCLALYYHNDDGDSLNYAFVINENSARVNVFDHYGYSGADHDFQQQIAGDTSRGEQLLYLQAMSGVKTFIRIPSLKEVFPEPVVINKAELVIPVRSDANDGFVKPAQLTLVKIESDSTLSFLLDELYGSAYFGGTYNSTTKEYRFNIATYIQNCILNSDYRGLGLYLAISGASVKGDRLVINGPANTENNLRLEITYTRIH